jgi:hypothetical protein
MMVELKGKAVPIRFKASVLASLSSTSEPIDEEDQTERNKVR